MVYFLVVAIVIILVDYLIRMKRLKEELEQKKDYYTRQLHLFSTEYTAIQKYYISKSDEEAFKTRWKDLYDDIKKYRIPKKYPLYRKMCEFKSIFSSIEELFSIANEQYSKNIIESTINNAYDDIKRIFSPSEYLAESSKKEFFEKYKELFQAISWHGVNLYPYLTVDIKNKCHEFEHVYKELDKKKESHNNKFITEQKTLHSSFFDRVLNYPLSVQQREAIVTAEDNCLVISAAGSGKTSTMEGKVRYLVDKRGVDPSKILMVTYTRKAANSLTKRLNIEGLECYTFHAFALKVIGDACGKRPTIYNEPAIKEQVYNTLLKQDSFLKAVNKYLLDYLHPVLKEFDYENNHAKYIVENKKRDRRSALPDMDGHYVFTPSDEERKICDILTKNGLKYHYEEPYEFDVADTIHRQYKPDFSIYYKGQDGETHRIYLEHFGVDNNGNVSRRWGDGTDYGWSYQNEKYREGMEWKRELHASKGTILIETTSADFQRGNVEEVLLQQLCEHGVEINPISQENLYQMLIQSSKKKADAVVSLISTFITLMKGRCTSISEIISQIPNYDRDKDIILTIIKPYYELYEKTLKEREEIDFTDAILMATECCNNGYHPRFDYILIDEFQDISIDKYEFLKSLRTKNPLTKLFCVGDDWQSIYRFSGSDMTLFKDFSDYFGFTIECKLENTYRFREPLISKSSQFIEKNPQQKHKQVRNPLQSTATTDIEFLSYGSDEEFEQNLTNIIDAIPSDKSIYLLGRYGFEINSFKSKKFKITGNDDSQSVTYNGRTMDYLTVHKAKGLESDYVILLNCNSGTYGFPSTIADDPVLSHVLSEADSYEYGEERRVFYVAITRSKLKTFVLYKVTTPSPFISEFMTSVEGKYGACPLCITGQRKLIKRGVTTNNKSYYSYVCTNQSFGCQYFETEFEESIEE